MDIRLKTLLSVIQTRNFTHTAEELMFTQPAVSHHIKQLENEYGIRIFEKSGKALQLTPAGALLAEYAEQSRVLENSFLAGMQDMMKEPTHFSIGVTVTPAEYLLPSLMAAFCKRHPQVTLDISCGAGKNLTKKLTDYEMDWILINSAAPDGFPTYPLLTDRSLVFVSADHPLAGAGKITLEQLRREKMILCYKNNSAMRALDEELQKNSFSVSELTVKVETNSMSVIKSLVAENVGVSILQESACRAEINEGKLVPLELEGVKMEKEIRFVSRPGFAYSAIFTELKEIYEQLTP